MNQATDKEQEVEENMGNSGNNQEKNIREKKKQEEEKRKTGMLEYSWLKKAMAFVIADILIIAFSYFAALMIRFDFVFSSIDRE